MPGFEVELFRASRPYLTFFVPGGRVDGDSGGFVLEELNRNIRICVKDKTAKVAKVRTKYPEWWLLLVDVALGIDQEDHADLRQMLSSMLTLDHPWDKVIVVNPSNPEAEAFELSGARANCWPQRKGPAKVSPARAPHK